MTQKRQPTLLTLLLSGLLLIRTSDDFPLTIAIPVMMLAGLVRDIHRQNLRPA